MINFNKTQQMTDIINESIQYSGIEKEVIGTPIYNRLHRVLQNSMVYLTYPSNKVKRFEHSVGTMHLAGEIFYYSVCNAEDDDLRGFFGEIEEEIINWRKEVENSELVFLKKSIRQEYEGKKILKLPIPKSKMYCQYYPGNIEEPQNMLLFLVTFQAVRLAGLLHDVGHLPYSHVLEYAFKDLFKRVTEIDDADRTDRHKKFLQVMEPYCAGDEKDEIHENIGKLLVDQIYQSIIDESPKMGTEGLFLAMTFFVAKSILLSKNGEDSIFSQIHSITAGTVDADRLDYCTRDAYCAGLLASKFNYERMVKAFVLKEKEDKGLPEEKLEIKTKKYLFCPMSKTADQIEDLLNRRWNIFTKMNFHHRVHKHEILLSEVIVDLGMKELDGEGTFEEELEVVLPLEISSIWRLIGELRTNRSLAYQIIQLDDSWIDTLLGNKFFERYGSSKYYNLSVYGNNPEWNRFEELISTKKRYHSLIKRSRDFRFLDEKFYDSMRSKILEMDASEEKHWDNFTLVKLSNSYLEFCKQTKSFCWNYCWDMIIGDIDDKKDIYSKAEIYLNSLKEEKDNCGVAHFLVRSCEFKTGYSVAKYPVNLTHMGKVFPLGQVSNIGDDLKNARNLLPLFHVFYLPQYDTSREEVIMCNINMIYEYLAEVLSKIVLDRLSEQPNPKKK